MNQQTIKQLNQLNQDFYNTVAKEFDSTRQYFWQGWNILLEQSVVKNIINHNNTLNILDLGCGNARFYSFLQQQLPKQKINYLGIDSNQELLNFANSHYQDHTNFQLQKQDIINSLLNNKNFLNHHTFDLIVSFGVFHHLPSFKLRVKLLQELKQRLNTNGVIALSLWQFPEYSRFQKKVVKLKELPPLENNDFILDWQRGKQAYRYCHYLDKAEQKKLIKESKTKLFASFRADGKEQDVNQYLVLK